ncbi:hypothetical protein Rumeso_04981 [Rubellimicrobium mesophilum DSM 19309]|uniref:Uncharacterized protein n=2 Tax=Rubellimicrobium TaxID=295418 RepID=A0A017HBB1_9RHOB|nr:hypothetical protein Rumeso_04981 [Rubellimicrobium mesophilum DSM 19309]
MVRDTLALAGDGLEPFWGLSVVLRAKLSPWERQSLAWAALMACDDEEAEGIAERVLGPPEGAGHPPVPFMDVAEEAMQWAAWASREELKTYLLACFNALPATERAKFLSLVMGARAA